MGKTASLLPSARRTLDAAAVILGTGFTSSWKGLFSGSYWDYYRECSNMPMSHRKTADELGLRRHAPGDVQTNQWDNYLSLRDPPSFLAPRNSSNGLLIYRGLVPYKNINRRDFAITFTTNNGYAFEAFSHWISAYFLGDKMRLPATPKEAFDATERNAEWLRKRFPGMLLWTNESYSSNLAFFTWPQVVDEILEDLELPSLRSGGNWLTWPFRVIDLAEIATLREERMLNAFEEVVSFDLIPRNDKSQFIDHLQASWKRNDHYRIDIIPRQA
ncbi:FAD/NAD(P)-binding domain-containing protein [Salix suchowensis]|nr:FAD/NAD(P)-binding domain-containing protein [Salix suchowensis]